MGSGSTRVRSYPSARETRSLLCHVMTMNTLLRASALRTSRQASALLLLLGSVASLGCASLFQSTNSSSGTTEVPDYAGPVTITNQGSQPICGVDLYHSDRTLEYRGERFSDAPLTTGQSRTIEFGFSLKWIRLLGCDGNTVVWDSIVPYRSGVGSYIYNSEGSVTVVDSGAQVLDGPQTVLVAMNRPLSEYNGPQGSLHASLSAGLLETVVQQTGTRWGTPVEWVTVSSDDYNIRRDDFGNITHRSFYTWVGIRGEDGECIAEYTEMMQQYDGSGYSSQSRVVRGDGARSFIPCEVHDQATGNAPTAPRSSAPAAAPSAAPTGGNCTNTCRTSNDGECDDGGPNSLYSICGLGTDCNDCGPR